MDQGFQSNPGDMYSERDLQMMGITPNGYYPPETEAILGQKNTSDQQPSLFHLPYVNPNINEKGKTRRKRTNVKPVPGGKPVTTGMPTVATPPPRTEKDKDAAIDRWHVATDNDPKPD